MKVNGRLEFDASSASEILNLRVQKLAGVSVPTFTAADTGRLIYVTSTGGGFDANTLYVGGSSGWVAVGVSQALQDEIDAIELTLGNFISSSGEFNASAFSAFNFVDDQTVTNLFQVLQQLDQAIITGGGGVDALNDLSDVALSSPTDTQILQYDSGVNNWVNVSIGPASGIQSQSDLLDDIAGISTAGVLYHNGTSITNLGLASPNSTISISVASGELRLDQSTVTIDTSAAGASLVKILADAYGRVVGTAAVSTGDLTPLLNTTYVNVTGDTVTGDITFSGGATAVVPTPVLSSHAANKAYVDALINGLSWKDSVRVATTAAINLATAPASIDGITLSSGDRVLVKNQGAPAENGIYVFNGAGSALTRALDMNEAAEFSAGTMFVREGTTNADTKWTQTAEISVVGTDAVTFVQADGGGAYAPGDALSLNLNTFNVLTDATTIRVGVGNVLEVVPGGIANVHLAADSVGTSNIINSNVTNEKLQFSYITFSDNQAEALSTDVDLGNTLTIAGGNAVTTTVTAPGEITVSVNPADIQLEDLGNISGTPTNRDVLVYVAGQWVPLPIYYLHEQTESSTSWVVTHGLSELYCNVTVIVDNEVVIPQSIVFDTASQLTITFNSAVMGVAVVMAVGIPV